MFLTFKVVFRKFMIDLGPPFILFIYLFIYYSSDCFDRLVVLFNCRICVCEYPLRVYCPWQPLTSTDFLYAYKVYSVYLCVYISVCIHVCLYTLRIFVFSFIIILPLNNLPQLICHKTQPITKLPPWYIWYVIYIYIYIYIYI